ncbi:hypothetical protein Bca101_058157 [Brassica carinata]
MEKTTKTKERLGDFELHSSPRKKENESTTKSTDSKLQRVHCYKKRPTQVPGLARTDKSLGRRYNQKEVHLTEQYKQLKPSSSLTRTQNRHLSSSGESLQRSKMGHCCKQRPIQFWSATICGLGRAVLALGRGERDAGVLALGRGDLGRAILALGRGDLGLAVLALGRGDRGRAILALGQGDLGRVVLALGRARGRGDHGRAVLARDLGRAVLARDLGRAVLALGRGDLGLAVLTLGRGDLG